MVSLGEYDAAMDQVTRKNLAKRIGGISNLPVSRKEMTDRAVDNETLGLRGDIRKENMEADLREAQQRGQPMGGLGDYFGEIEGMFSNAGGMYDKAWKKLGETSKFSEMLNNEYRNYDKQTSGLSDTALDNMETELSTRTGLIKSLEGQTDNRRVGEAVARAGADANSQMEMSKQQMTEDARAQGIDPTSPAFQARMGRMMSRGALGRVTAKEQGRRVAEEDLFNRRASLAQLSTGAAGGAAFDMISQGKQSRLDAASAFGMDRANAYGNLAASQGQTTAAQMGATASLANAAANMANAGSNTQNTTMPSTNRSWSAGLSGGENPANWPGLSVGGSYESKMAARAKKTQPKVMA